MIMLVGVRDKEIASGRKLLQVKLICHMIACRRLGLLFLCELNKIVYQIAAESDEIIRLRAELAKMKADLAKKDELLRTYESIYSAA